MLGTPPAVSGLTAPLVPVELKDVPGSDAGETLLDVVVVSVLSAVGWAGTCPPMLERTCKHGNHRRKDKE